MRTAFIGLLALLNFVFESTLCKYLVIRHIKPNMSVALVVCYAILRGSVEGAAIGLFTGLLQDVFFGTSVGYYALIYMAIGYICGIPTNRFFKDNFFLPLILSVLCTVFYGLFVYVTGFLVRGRFDFSFFFNNIILPETVYTAIFSFFIYRILFGMNSRLEKYEHSNRKVF